MKKVKSIMGQQFDNGETVCNRMVGDTLWIVERWRKIYVKL